MFAIRKTQSLIVSHNEMNQGLFGMVFLDLFEALPILEKNEITVSKLHWDIRTKQYGSIFQNVLEYNSESTRNRLQAKKRIKLSSLRKQKPQYALGDDFVKLNKLFFKYFRIPKTLDEIATSFGLGEFLGIHYRGTDKINHYDNTVLIKKDFYQIIESYISANNITKVFIASDEEDLLNYFASKYPDIELKSSRMFNNFYPHHSNPDPQRNAKEAMIDMLCLSKCKTVLKASSALSSWAKVIEPSLEIYRLNGLRMFTDIPYFPEAYVPLLPKNDQYSKACNNILDKVQKGDWSYEHGEQFNNFFVKER